MLLSSLPNPTVRARLKGWMWKGDEKARNEKNFWSCYEFQSPSEDQESILGSAQLNTSIIGVVVGHSVTQQLCW